MQQWSPRPVLYRDHEDPYLALKTIAGEMGWPVRAIGIEERILKVSQMRRLSTTFPDARFIDASGLVEKIAGRPSAAETACMRQAARVTEIGIQAGVAELGNGVPAGQVIGKMHEAMYRAGQRDFDMALVCIWAGPDGGLMHDTRADRVIGVGDVVTVEVWGVDNQYKAGAQASVFIGSDPPPAVVEAYDLVAAMYRAARDRVRAGLTAGDVFDAANEVYRAAHGSDYYRRCGGSMGLTIFTIDLVRGRSDPLFPGMCLLIQTLVDDPFLLTCAGTVLVTESGCEELTAALPQLKTIPARA
jgi:Xaa-Pro dipeptidase